MIMPQINNPLNKTNMKIKEFIENWIADKMPASTRHQFSTLSEGYRAYWELKRKMWETTEFKPLNDK
jgi:hypothetical protein